MEYETRESQQQLSETEEAVKDEETASGLLDLELEGADEGDLEADTEDAKVSLDKNDRSLFEFNHWYQLGRLILDTEWQREFVWDRKRSSRLIESFLIDIPIPIIYLAVNDKGKYEVIDGLQRLTSVFDFFGNKYRLTGLEIRRDLNGLQFKDLPEQLQAKLEAATLRTFELSARTPKDLMFLIFERLNTGGIALNDMEIRNCLYRGPLNNLIKELARYEEFQSCVNQRNIQKRMKDRTLVLRFLAFYQMHYSKVRKGLKKFFNEFFETYRDPIDSKINEFRNQFRKAIRASYTIFGGNSFRLRRISEKGGGEWSPQVNASVFQAVSVSFTEYDLGALTRAADSILEEYLDLLATDDNWVDCCRTATGDQSRIEYTFKIWQERLKAVMTDFEPDDPNRCFSRQLKEEMFDQDNTCAICGQKISLVNDAALDHDKHYWRGGRTVPENARLVHRLCNLRRPD